MTDRAAAFLSEWTRLHVPGNCAPALRADKAIALARRCRAEASEAEIPGDALTLAAYGNLVSYFEDALAIAATAREAEHKK